MRIVSICILLIATNFQFPTAAAKSAENIRVKYDEEINILEDGRANITFSIFISSITLAGFYKTALGLTDAPLGKEIDIPLHATMPSHLDVGEGVRIENMTSIKTTVAARDKFISSFAQEQKNSLGIIVTDVYKARARMNYNGTCEIRLQAYATLPIINVTRYEEGYKWEMVFGHANSSMAGNATGFILGKIVFIKYMLDAIPGNQEYEQKWTTHINLPDSAHVIDTIDKRWVKNLNGNTKLFAHAESNGKSILINETMKVDESEMEEMDNLTRYLIDYKTFSINCSMAEQAEETIKEEKLIKWSWTWKWKWSVKLIDINVAWNHTGSNYAIYAKARSKVKISGYLGWKLQGELIPPSVKLKWFEAWIMPEIDANIRVNASASINWSKTWSKNLYTYSTTYVVWIGFIPVVIAVNLKLDGEIHVELSAQIDIVAGARYFSSIKLGTRYAHGWHDINEKIVDKGYTFNITQCKFIAQLKPSLKARLEALLYYLAGPFIEAVVYLLANLNVTRITRVSFELYLGFGVNAGVTFHSLLKKLLKLHDYSWPLWEWKTRLWNGTWVFGNASVDRTPPSTILKYKMPYWTDGSHDTITTRTNISLDAEDDNSGVNKTWYRVDNGTWKNYTKPFKIHVPGQHNISYYSIDNNNNTEAINVRNVTVIMTEPESFKIVGEPKHGLYVNCSTPITLSSYYPLPWKIKWRIGYNGSWSNWSETDWNTDAIINFSEECAHSLEWYAVDYIGNEEEHHIQTHIVDCTPPVINLVQPSIYFKINNFTGCIDRFANITITAIDSASNSSCISGMGGIYWGFWLNGVWHPENENDTYNGNAVLYFQMNNKSWYIYNSSRGIEFIEECRHILEYWATDNVGNRIGVFNHTYYVDSTFPVINISVGNPNHMISSSSYRVKTSTPITINATDSGCCSNITVEYRIWYNGSWNPWEEINVPFIFNFSRECKHYLEVRAYDCLNHTTYRNITFYVDDSPPSSWITTEIGCWKNYVTMLTEFTIWATEYGCEHGSYLIHYSIMGPENSRFYLNGKYYNANGSWHTGIWNQPISFQLKGENLSYEGKYIISYWAEDDIGTSESKHHTQTFYLENECPHTRIYFGSPKYEQWISPTTPVFLNAYDNGSGILRTFYSIDGGEKNIYDGSFFLPKDGEHVISFYSIDYVGHVENEETFSVNVDGTPPSTEVRNYRRWITSDDVIKLESTDDGCGVKATYYSIDGNKWKLMENDIKIEEEGEHVLKFYSIDNLGNKEEVKMKEICVDDSPPKIDLSVPEEGSIYMWGRKIMSIPLIKIDGIIIGDIEMKIYVKDASPLKTMLYMDGEKLMETGKAEISYAIEKTSFAVHTVEVISHDFLNHMSIHDAKFLIINP